MNSENPSIIRSIIEDPAIDTRIRNSVAATYRGQENEFIKSTDFPQLPHVQTLMNDHPKLYDEVDRILHKWRLEKEHISYLGCGQEALVFKLYGVPFILKLLHHDYLDAVSANHFVIHPLHRESVTVLPQKIVTSLDMIPEVRVVIERELSHYRTNEVATSEKEMLLPYLRPEKIAELKAALKMEGLNFLAKV